MSFVLQLPMGEDEGKTESIFYTCKNYFLLALPTLC